MLAGLLRLHRSLGWFQRAILLWMLGLTLGLGVMLWSAQTTQDRALERMRANVTRCFISPGRLDPARVGACAGQFDDPDTPGNDYLQVQQRSADATRRFERLSQESAADNERLAELENRLRKLETGG